MATLPMVYHQQTWTTANTGIWDYGRNFITNNTITGGSRVERDKIIEALFRIKPDLADAYDGDKDKFAKALIAAGNAAFSDDSLATLKSFL